MRLTTQQLRPELSERRVKLEECRALATKFGWYVRLRDGVVERYSKRSGGWVQVPEEASQQLRPELSERRAKLERLRELSTKFNWRVRLRGNTIERYSKEQGCWVPVP